MPSPFVFAVIPARSGSKRLPGKNLRVLGGRSLVGHAVAAAHDATTLTRFVVSTASPEIAEEARRYGADPPFLRPPELATDDVPIIPVLQHAVRWLEGSTGARVDVVVALQPTSPFRTGADIDRVVRKLLDTGADSAQTVTPACYHPYFMTTLDGDRTVPIIPPGYKLQRKSDAPPAYQPSGAVYATRRDLLMEQGRILGDDNRAIVMGFEASVNIDTEWDFRLAELLLREGRAPAAAIRT
jgi:CMP-N-acetylneuraminic acid synthetase